MNQDDARVVARAVAPGWAGWCWRMVLCEDGKHHTRTPNFTPENYPRVIEWVREQEFLGSENDKESLITNIVGGFLGFLRGNGDLEKLCEWTIRHIAEALRQHKSNSAVDVNREPQAGA